MKFRCEKCGEEHEGWPAIAFDAPHFYHILSEEDKQNIAEISDDFCTIRHEDQTDYFVRAVLRQKVNNHCQNLEYGVWVSLSEKNHKDYYDNFDTGNSEKTYFGYLCNKIPEYDTTLSIKTDVVVSKGNNRPEIIPHDNQIEIPFVRDYYNGIAKEEAEKRINSMLKA